MRARVEEGEECEGNRQALVVVSMLTGTAAGK